MDQDKIEIRPVNSMGEEIVPLIVEADGEGHRFMHRLSDEWHSGQNRFHGKGEFLLGVYVEGRLVAVGGLNKDPYADIEGIGRLRHVYVTSSARRLGIGTLLVEQITREAASAFSILRLRTTTAEAAMFYERLGFRTTSDEAATHVIDLVPA